MDGEAAVHSSTSTAKDKVTFSQKKKKDSNCGKVGLLYLIMTIDEDDDDDDDR